MTYFVRFALICFIALNLSACVAPQPIIAQSAAPVSGQGYVAGIFSGEGVNYAFGLRNVANNAEVTMPFFAERGLKGRVKEEEQLNMIALLPGTYQVTQWVTYATLGNEVITRKRLDGPNQKAITFDVRAGRVTFIGKFRVVESREYRVQHFGIRPGPAHAEEMAWAFNHTYPAFSMELVDPVRGAVLD